jgi:hypothetical protein
MGGRVGDEHFAGVQPKKGGADEDDCRPALHKHGD